MGYIQHKSEESLEDYLETILILSRRLSAVRSIDVANELDFSKPSVSVAMKNLKNFKETLSIDVKGKTVVLHSHDILYLERQRHTTTIIDNKQELKCSYKLDEMSNKLPSYFIRCHRSYIINIDYLSHYENGMIQMKNGSTVPVSRLRQKELIDTVFQYIKGRE